MSQLEPATQVFIDSLSGATPLYTLSPCFAPKSLAAEGAPALMSGATSVIRPNMVPRDFAHCHCYDLVARINDLNRSP